MGSLFCYIRIYLRLLGWYIICCTCTYIELSPLYSLVDCNQPIDDQELNTITNSTTISLNNCVYTIQVNDALILAKKCKGTLNIGLLISKCVLYICCVMP
jgi:hypothetical protein